jgi:hypothetical protein
MLTIPQGPKRIYADFHCQCGRRVVAIEGDKDFVVAMFHLTEYVIMNCPSCGKNHNVPAKPPLSYKK